MIKNKTVFNILAIPKRFQELKNISFYNLIQETMYFDKFDEIFEDSIAIGLSENLNLINDWIEWSENKRSNNGWYITQTDIGTYEVGFMNKKGEKEQNLEFFDRRNACAAYIKREIEEIRNC